MADGAASEDFHESHWLGRWWRDALPVVQHSPHIVSSVVVSDTSEDEGVNHSILLSGGHGILVQHVVIACVVIAADAAHAVAASA